jgi:hypothetical protein
MKKRALISDLEGRLEYLEELSGRLPNWIRDAARAQVEGHLKRLQDTDDDDDTAAVRKFYVVDKDESPVRQIRKIQR